MFLNLNGLSSFFVQIGKNSEKKTQLLFVVCVLLVGVTGCAAEYVGNGEDLPNTPYEKAWVDEHTGNDENLGPNSPGYLGPDGEYNMYPMTDPR